MQTNRSYITKKTRTQISENLWEAIKKNKLPVPILLTKDHFTSSEKSDLQPQNQKAIH